MSNQYIKKEHHRIIPVISYDKINTKESIIYVLQKIESDEELFLSIYRNHDIYEKFIITLRKVFNKKIELLLGSIISKFIKHAYDQNILTSFAEILRDNNSDFINNYAKEFVEAIPNEFGYLNIMIILITPSNILNIIKFFDSYNSEQINESVARFFWYFQNTNKNIFKLSEPHYSSYYKKIIKFRDEYQESIKDKYKEPELLPQFEFYLNCGKQSFHSNVFSFYSINKENLKKDIGPKHLDRLKE